MNGSLNIMLKVKILNQIIVIRNCIFLGVLFVNVVIVLKKVEAVLLKIEFLREFRVVVICIHYN